MNTQDLHRQLETHLSELAARIDDARASDDLSAWLDLMARFHRYSPANQALIYWQNPDATLIKGYQAWQELKRQVKKGEHGIAILAPILYSKREEQPSDSDATKDPDETTTKRLAFKVVYVFDVTQTEGEDLPPTPTWTTDSPDGAELADRLTRYAEQLGLTVTDEDTHRARGYTTEGHIAIKAGITPGGKAKTLAHELAHQVLGHLNQGIMLDHDMGELEAEATAYVVCRYAGLEADFNSPMYIALHNGSADSLRRSAERVSKAAQQIITGLQDSTATS